MSDISERKQAHLDLCLEPNSQGSGNLFSEYKLPYRALPEINLADVSTETELFKKRLSQPLIIASMTGGVAHAQTINTNLAIAAEACGVAMGVGSQRIALEKDEARETFELVRKHAPTAVIFANMGAIQLNYGRTVDDYRRVVDMIGADALYLHINPLQEAIQPGGDTNYAGLLDKIADVVAKVGVPVFAKEVGHGLDVVTAKALIERGVKGVDCAGTSGTSWAWVEAKRAGDSAFESWFKEYGLRSNTLLEQYRELPQDIYKVVSGGVRTPIEAVKARALGANFYSFAQPFLAPALEGPEAVAAFIRHFQRGIAITLFTAGCKNWEAAAQLPLQKK
ncbi:MAG TPA: type 2 isopentenyl-diphosphate Delta-isomerase [Patescibacteria group bacterium]